jgi:hypothetical protein
LAEAGGQAPPAGKLTYLNQELVEQGLATVVQEK